MATTSKTRTKYMTRLCGTDEAPELELFSRQVTTIRDSAGRRQWTKESTVNAKDPDVTLARMDMEQAAELLSALASDIGFMAVPSNREKS